MDAVLGALFLSAFLSATLLPGSSEVLLAAVVSKAASPVGVAILVATFGNTLGSCVNWCLGRFFASYRAHRWFPVPVEKYDRYCDWYARWGVWSLLMSWVPIIGDPLTIVAGAARTPVALFTAIVFFAKGVRYLVVVAAVTAII